MFITDRTFDDRRKPPASRAPSSRRRTALVTGGSSGIGLEFSRLLAQDGCDLVVVARDGPKLEEMAGLFRRRYRVSVRPQAADLSEPGAAGVLWSGLESAGVAMDILVNNAGVGLHGPLSEQAPDAIGRMLELNVGALTSLTRLALPGMRERRWGRILNVASLAAYQPGGPRMAAYYASKAYVLSFSKGLARELRGTGVSVTVVCPGPTRTAFEEKSGAQRTALYRWLPGMQPDAVARAAYRGMWRGAQVVIPGLLTKLLAAGGELPPRGIALEINRRLLQGT
jgi:short-subunit dehydrogenase